MDKKTIQVKSLFRPAIIVPAAVVLVLCLLPQFIKGYPLHTLTLIILYAALGSAWNWLGGFAGQASLAHAVFFGLGAYINSMLQVHFEVNPWVAMLVAMAGVGIISILVGLPVFRLSGPYFSIATIAIGEVVKIIFINWKATGGAVGMYLPIRESSLLNFQFNDKAPYYYIILAFYFVAVSITYWLKNSRSGYYFRAIKEDPQAAKALGINIVQSKLLAMVLSGMMCAMVGSFYVNFTLYIDPDNVFRFMTSVQIALIAVLGGVGSVWGPLIGSVIILLLSEGSRAYLGGIGAGLDFVIYGLMIMLIAIFQPNGIIGAVENYRKKKRLKKRQMQEATDAAKEVGDHGAA
ncbi:MAG: branched-chain amino acid ABC transporter permease [Clostridiales bacterium]|jgi:branched-chain amino acid transport system permease protein|nr:branched-chain amino acid ABC transporter permease [Clostridiales bacterium]